jgi:hypothetical protein
VLPDINTNDRDVGEERVLFRGRRNLKLLGCKVQGLSFRIRRDREGKGT